MPFKHFLVVLFACCVPEAALAHTGVGDTSGLAHGFMHPLTGMDHVMAMVAVGLLAANLGGRAIWAAPLTFMVLMGLGGVAGATGWQLPMVETGIAASVLVLGLAVALNIRGPASAAMFVVGAFAVFHGFAHGAEMPPTASGAGYGLGFLSATGLLHGAGIAVGLVCARWQPILARGLGAAFALAGAGLLTGAL